MPFGLWAVLSWLKERVAHCEVQGLSAVSCTETAELIFAVWVVDSGGPKEAQVQSYLLGGANVRIRLNLANE